MFGPINAVDLTDLQAVWLAAFLDAEGSIGVQRSKKAAKRSGYYYYPAVQVSNTNEDLIRAVYDLVGENASLAQKTPPNPRAKDIWNLQVNQRAIPTVLKQILPFLIAKTRQAELVLKFCEVKWDMGWQESGDEMYEPFYQELKALNKRGR